MRLVASGHNVENAWQEWYQFWYDDIQSPTPSRAPLICQYGLNIIPPWISNQIHYKVSDENTYPFQLNFYGATVAPLKFVNGWVISSHNITGHVITYPRWV